jgi:hypothetical protein
MSQKKATVAKSETLLFLIPRGIFNKFLPIFLHKTYLSTTVGKIKSPCFIHNIHCNFFAQCKKSKYFLDRNSPLIFETI